MDSCKSDQCRGTIVERGHCRGTIVERGHCSGTSVEGIIVDLRDHCI